MTDMLPGWALQRLGHTFPQQGQLPWSSSLTADSFAQAINALVVHSGTHCSGSWESTNTAFTLGIGILGRGGWRKTGTQGGRCSLAQS